VSERMYRDQANRLRDEIAKLEKRRADEAGRLARLRQEIGRIKNSITKSTSASTLRSKEGQIAGKERQGADLEKKIAGYASDLATKHRQLTKADENANKAAEQARKKQERTDKDRRTTEVAHARQLTREAERQARAHVWQPAVTLQYPLPQKLKVLVLAANPLDQDQLRLDEEVRAITEKIRMSKYRDRVELISAWAVRTTDLFQALNEHEPHVVHFSGHGSANDEIVFQDELGNSKFVSKAALTELIAATGGHIRLIVFNTCFSRNQAEAVVQHVEAAIGVGTSIGDDAARFFAAAFYGAVGFGLSVELAFKQGLAQLAVEGIPDDQRPELFTRPGLDATALVLVQAPSSGLTGYVA
jgi:ribosomal protein S25